MGWLKCADEPTYLLTYLDCVSSSEEFNKDKGTILPRLLRNKEIVSLRKDKNNRSALPVRIYEQWK